MNVEILTPEKIIFNGEASFLSVPGSDGGLGILDNHAPLITTLKEGVVKVDGGKGDIQTFDIKGGTLEVLKNKVIILAE